MNLAKMISTTSNSMIRKPCLRMKLGTFRRTFSSSSDSSAVPSIPAPTKIQLRNHYIGNGLPMVGFGIMDQTVMIQAGNMIDCTIGVQLGLSTLTAAAVGAIVSNLSGIIFGGTLESLAKAWGLPPSKLTSEQRSLGYVKRGRLLSQALGIFMGCCIGLMNLLFIDTEKSSSLKLLNKSEEDEFAFEVEISNDVRDDATVLIVKGPDRDGILAGVTAALTLNGCSLLEVNAHSDNERSDVIEDTFVILDQETKGKIRDDELERLCKITLDACRDGPNLLKYKVKDLEEKNQALQARVYNLESTLMKRRISVRPSGKGMVRGD